MTCLEQWRVLASAVHHNLETLRRLSMDQSTADPLPGRAELDMAQQALCAAECHILRAIKDPLDQLPPITLNCNSCSPADGPGCVHRGVLAAQIIDRTFDSHHRMLRRRLLEAEKEIERWRSGSVLESERAEKRRIETKMRDLVEEHEREKARWLQMLISSRKKESVSPGDSSQSIVSAPDRGLLDRVSKEQTERMSMLLEAALMMKAGIVFEDAATMIVSGGVKLLNLGLRPERVAPRPPAIPETTPERHLEVLSQRIHTEKVSRYRRELGGERGAPHTTEKAMEVQPVAGKLLENTVKPLHR